MKSRTSRYTLDLSGHAIDSKAGIVRFGGLFRSIEDAVDHGLVAVRSGRFVFNPEVLWVRDEEGNVVREDRLTTT